MPEITVDVEIFCEKCGAGLCNQSRSTDGRLGRSRGPAIHVEPCKKCLDDAEMKGYEEGYSKGKQDYEVDQ